MFAPMADDRPRSSYESDNVPWSKAVARRTMRATIGQELKTHYQAPQDLPREMLQILLQFSAPQEEE
jgi:hypothetical protein